MKGRKALLFCVMGIVLCAESVAQPFPMPPATMRNVFLEAFAHRAADTALSWVTIQYRIDLEFFMAQREAAEGTRGAFERRGEVLMELIDRSGTSRSRRLRPVHRGEAGAEHRSDEVRWIEGSASFAVPPGEYEVFFEVTDLQSQHRFLDRARKVDTRGVRDDRAAVTTSTFMRPSYPGSGELRPVNYGGDLHLSQPALLYIEFAGLPAADSTARVKCAFAGMDGDQRQSGGTVTLADTSLRLRRGLLIPPPDSAESPLYARQDSVAGAWSILVPLATGKLLLRPYKLQVTVTAGPREISYERPVRVVWPGMPASLRNVDYALSALRYIAPPRVLDSLASGSFEDRRDNLEGFWRDKDPERRNPYNQLMIQYYQRVDYASANFGTLRQPDGLGTDRAKIYILFGPPSRSERSLDPAAGNRETWFYDRLKRTFVFEDQLKNGNYILKPGQ